MPAQPLTPEQLADAARLKELFSSWQKSRKAAKQPSSQEAASDVLGFNQSSISQYINGFIPLNADAAAKFASLLGCTIADFSPTIAEQVATFAAALPVDPAPADSHVRVPDEDDDGFIRDDYVRPIPGALPVTVGSGPPTVPIRAVKPRLQAGVNGFVEEPDLDVDNGHFQVPTYVIQQLNLNPANLIIMTVKGRSMEPMYFEDDKVLVDTSKQMPKNNECFAVNWNGESIVKCLIKRGSGWALYSMNRDPQYHTIDIRSGHCRIIGQVVWQPDRIVVGRL